MPRGISRVFRNRPGSAPALMVFLLAMAGLAGDTAWFRHFAGSSVGNETREAPTLGYYEGLINAPREIVAAMSSAAAGLAAVRWRRDGDRQGTPDLSALGNEAQSRHPLERNDFSNQ